MSRPSCAAQLLCCALLGSLLVLALHANGQTVLTNGVFSDLVDIPAGSSHQFTFSITPELFAFAGVNNLTIVAESCVGDISVDIFAINIAQPIISSTGGTSYSGLVPFVFSNYTVEVKANEASSVQVFVSANMTFPEVSSNQVTVEGSGGLYTVSWEKTSDDVQYRVFYSTENEATFNLETRCGWLSQGEGATTDFVSYDQAVQEVNVGKTDNVFITVAARDANGLITLYDVSPQSGDTVGEPLVSDNTAIVVAIVFGSLMVALLAFVIVFRKIQLKKMAEKKALAEGTQENERLTS